MMKFKSGLFFLVMLVLVSGDVTAQNNTAAGGSAYSVFGVGAPKDLSSAQFRGMGIFGVSGISSQTTTLANPATWSNAVFTQATTGVNLSNHLSKHGTGVSTNTNLEAAFLHLVFPVISNKLGLSVALYPSTRSNLNAQSTQFFSTSPGDTVFYKNDLKTVGGITKFEVGLGFRINSNLSIGYAPSISFLTLQNTETITFSSSLYNDQNLIENQSGTTFSNRFGITGTFYGLFNSRDKLSFGGTLNLPFEIGAKQRILAEKQIEGSDGQSVEFSVTEGDISIPMEASFGVGYAPTPMVDFSAEALIQKWSEYSNAINSADALSLSDRMKVGFGGQFHPYRRNSDAFFSRFRYSAGVSYDTGHLTFQTDDISTLWLNTGLGILSRSPSSIDVSFQYGFRGTTNNSLIQERIWAIGFSVNLAEPMFIRRKLR